MDAKDKRAHAEEVLSEVLKLMGVSARLEVKELAATEAATDKPAAPASISVALFPEEELPGLSAGKRSPVADALQFLSNKIVNRGPEKKWINLGVGAHPEPKQPRQPPPPQAQPQQAAPAAQPAQGQAAAPAQQKPQKQKKGGRGGEAKGGQPHGERERPQAIDESKIEVADDPVLQQLGHALAQKAAAFGRYYAVIPTAPEERVNLRKGASGVNDVSAKLDGEGRHRRVVFVPANPKPMPKKSAMPDYDDEEDVDEE